MGRKGLWVASTPFRARPRLPLVARPGQRGKASIGNPPLVAARRERVGVGGPAQQGGAVGSLPGSYLGGRGFESRPCYWVGERQDRLVAQRAFGVRVGETDGCRVGVRRGGPRLKQKGGTIKVDAFELIEQLSLEASASARLLAYFLEEAANAMLAAAASLRGARDHPEGPSVGSRQPDAVRDRGVELPQAAVSEILGRVACALNTDRVLPTGYLSATVDGRAFRLRIGDRDWSWGLVDDYYGSGTAIGSAARWEPPVRRRTERQRKE